MYGSGRYHILIVPSKGSHIHNRIYTRDAKSSSLKNDFYVFLYARLLVKGKFIHLCNLHLHVKREYVLLFVSIAEFVSFSSYPFRVILIRQRRRQFNWSISRVSYFNRQAFHWTYGSWYNNMSFWIIYKGQCRPREKVFCWLESLFIIVSLYRKMYIGVLKYLEIIIRIVSTTHAH